MRWRARPAWLVAVVALAVVPGVRGQQWSRTIRRGSADEGMCVRQTSDGGVVLAGVQWGGTSRAGLVVKLDAAGEVSWQKSYDGWGEERADAIEQTSDGGFIVVGMTSSFGAGGDDAWVLRLDGAGDVLWQRTYGGTGRDSANAVDETRDGDFIVAGRTGSFGAGADDAWVMKLDPSGDPIWQRTYGGPEPDETTAIRSTADGGYIVAGFTTTNPLGWLFKLDGSGDIEWQTALGTGSGESRLYSVCETGDGEFAAGGTVFNDGLGIGPREGWLVKLGPDGDVLWQRRYTSGMSTQIVAVDRASDGNLLAAGGFDSGTTNAIDQWVLEVDQAGATVWQVGYGESSYEWARSVQATLDGGVVVAGTGESIKGILVSKLNALGDIPGCWLRTEPNVAAREVAVPVRSVAALMTSENVSGTSSALVGSPVFQTSQRCFQPRIDIALSTRGTGTGSVACQPNPVDYGFTSTCTATPALGSFFAGATTTCTGSLTGTNPFTVGPVTADCTVEAGFSLNRYILSVNVNHAEWGVATCTPNPATHGSTVECRAVPGPGYVLESISGCGGETVDGVLRFVATSDCTVTVVFQPRAEPIPALGWLGLGATAGLLALIGLIALRRGAPSV